MIEKVMRIKLKKAVTEQILIGNKKQQGFMKNMMKKVG